MKLDIRVQNKKLKDRFVLVTIMPDTDSSWAVVVNKVIGEDLTWEAAWVSWDAAFRRTAETAADAGPCLIDAARITTLLDGILPEGSDHKPPTKAELLDWIEKVPV